MKKITALLTALVMCAALSVTCMADSFNVHDAAVFLGRTFGEEYPDDYAGCWNDDGDLVIALTTDEGDARAVYEEMIANAALASDSELTCGIKFEVHSYSFNQLQAIKDHAEMLMRLDDDPYGIVSCGISPMDNCVLIGVSGTSDDLRAELKSILESVGVGDDAVRYDEHTEIIPQTAPRTFDPISILALSAIVSACGMYFGRKKK